MPGRTIVVSSHILAELDEYSTHMLVLRSGKVTHAGVAFDTTQRHTRTWALYDGRWQITAEHASAVAAPAPRD